VHRTATIQAQDRAAGESGSGTRFERYSAEEGAVGPAAEVIGNVVGTVQPAPGKGAGQGGKKKLTALALPSVRPWCRKIYALPYARDAFRLAFDGASFSPSDLARPPR